MKRAGTALLAFFLFFALHLGDVPSAESSDSCCEPDQDCATECADVCPSCVCCADLVPATLAGLAGDCGPARKFYDRIMDQSLPLIAPLPSEIPHVPRTVALGI